VGVALGSTILAAQEQAEQMAVPLLKRHYTFS
jgi:hypothetical protein